MKVKGVYIKMKKYLGNFKDNTGSFLITEGSSDNSFIVSCSKKTIPAQGVDLAKVAQSLSEFGYSFEVEVGTFLGSVGRVFQREGSIRSFYQLQELLKRSLNQRDEIQLMRLAEVLEQLTQARQLTRLLSSVVDMSEELEVSVGVSRL